MKYLFYFRLQLKRYLKLLPYLFLATIILSGILFIVSFFATKTVGSEKKVEKKSIYFSSEDSSPIIKIAVNSLSKTESLTRLFNVEEVDNEKLLEYKNGNNTVVCVSVPEGFLAGINNGETMPIKLYFSSKTSVYSLIITELSLAAKVSLESAQAGIFTLYDYYELKGHQDVADAANDDMNMKYIKKALTRNGFFNTKHVSALGTVDSRMYYLSTSIITVFMMLGCLFIVRIKSIGNSINIKLTQKGIGEFYRTICEVVSIAITMYVLYGLLVLALHFAKKRIEWLLLDEKILLKGGILICLFCALTVSMIAALIESRFGALLVLFVSVIACEFISGAFLPSAFLPNVLTKIDKYLPTRYIFEFARSMMNGYISDIYMKNIMIYFLIAFLVSVLCGKLREVRS